ncbi:hypothetical protein D918_05745 [Trichuris suis]|nr:hypothetical protein D918_05745 [Trichuris suis]
MGSDGDMIRRQVGKLLAGTNIFSVVTGMLVELLSNWTVKLACNEPPARDDDQLYTGLQVTRGESVSKGETTVGTGKEGQTATALA